MYINGNKIKVKRYSSGEFKFIKSYLNSFIINNKVEILYMNEESIFELMLIVNYYTSNNIMVDLILSYLPYQRMDHKNRDELDTLSYVANLFNNLKLNKLTICEPHSNINDFNNAKMFSYINALKDDVFKQINFDINKDYVVFTDKGGLNRYNNITPNKVYFNKVRDMETGLIVKHEIVGNIKPEQTFLIVDDIISTGDTIVNVVDHLTSLGADKIYVLCGHFEKNKYNKRLLQNKNIIKIFSTNSLTKQQNKKLKLYNVKEIFYE